MGSESTLVTKLRCNKLFPKTWY